MYKSYLGPSCTGRTNTMLRCWTYQYYTLRFEIPFCLVVPINCRTSTCWSVPVSSPFQSSSSDGASTGKDQPEAPSIRSGSSLRKFYPILLRSITRLWSDWYELKKPIGLDRFFQPYYTYQN